jgi:hypothetical protein
MAKDTKTTGYTHDASDRKLDHATDEAIAADKQANDQTAGGAGHDPAHIREHSDAGKDRLFEGRQQHDEAEKNSEKTRLARDVQKHDHEADDDLTDAGSGPSAKRKS